MSLPAMMKRSARLRASVSVDMIQPDVCRILKLRYCASLERVIDDAAAALGERHHRAHALDIGGKPAIERQLRLADQLGRLLDRLGEIDILAGDL